MLSVYFNPIIQINRKIVTGYGIFVDCLAHYRSYDQFGLVNIPIYIFAQMPITLCD